MSTESCGNDRVGIPKGPKGDRGYNGWSPKFAVVNDGARRVLQLTAWIGGTGATPTSNINEYLGTNGYTPVIADAIDIRGSAGIPGTPGTPSTPGTNGDPGTNGWSPSFAIETGVNGYGQPKQVLKLIAWINGTGPTPTNNIGEYVGAMGFVPLFSNATNIRGTDGTTQTIDTLTLPDITWCAEMPEPSADQKLSTIIQTLVTRVCELSGTTITTVNPNLFKAKILSNVTISNLPASGTGISTKIIPFVDDSSAPECFDNGDNFNLVEYIVPVGGVSNMDFVVENLKFVITTGGVEVPVKFQIIKEDPGALFYELHETEAINYNTGQSYIHVDGLVAGSDITLLGMRAQGISAVAGAKISVRVYKTTNDGGINVTVKSGRFYNIQR